MNLPLTNKLNEENIFSQLNLPLSSKWQDIKKAYENKTKELVAEIKSVSEQSQKTHLEQKLKRLELSYQSFSQRVGLENSKMHETKDALQSIGLDQTSDWDKVSRRFEELRQNKPDEAKILEPQLAILDRNKELLTPQSGLGKRTLLTSALVLGTAGVSLAAFYHLNQDEKEDIMAEVDQAEGLQVAEGTTSTNIPAYDQADMDKYIVDNTSAEDEMMSLLGLAPTPGLSLSLQYKMQVFSALVNTI